MAIRRHRLDQRPLRVWLPLALLLTSAWWTLSCGGSPQDDLLTDEARMLALSDDPPAPVAAYGVGPTVTLYPTDTPAPTPAPTDTPAPTPTMLGFLPHRPTLPPSPTPAIHTVEVSAGNTPTVAPAVPTATPVEVHRGLYGNLLWQTFFGMHEQPEVGAELPQWPDSQTVFLTRTTRFLVWYQRFDLSNVDHEHTERCLFRVSVAVGPPDRRQEHVVHQENVEVLLRPATEENNVLQVTLVLGQDVPGFWTPGDYRAEFWDAQDRVVAAWDFKVG